MPEAALLPLVHWEAFYVVLLLLFIGIHNAWDTATYVAVGRRHAASEPDESR